MKAIGVVFFFCSVLLIGVWWNRLAVSDNDISFPIEFTIGAWSMSNDTFYYYAGVKLSCGATKLTKNRYPSPNRYETGDVVMIKSLKYGDDELVEKAPPPPPIITGKSRTYYLTDRQVVTDTLVSQDTIYFYPKDSIEFGFLEVRAVIDSISGAINGKVQIQKSHFGLNWETVEESLINGSVPVVTKYTPPYFYGKFRVVAITWRSRMKAGISVQYREREMPQ